jgi:hypothetical protein
MRLLRIISLGAVLTYLIYGCTKDPSDPNAPAAVPLPPTNLVATASSLTDVELRWKDNSTNETGFKIERKTNSTSYQLVGESVVVL